MFHDSGRNCKWEKGDMFGKILQIQSIFKYLIWTNNKIKHDKGTLKSLWITKSRDKRRENMCMIHSHSKKKIWHFVARLNTLKFAYKNSLNGKRFRLFSEQNWTWKWDKKLRNFWHGSLGIWLLQVQMGMAHKQGKCYTILWKKYTNST